MEKKRSKLADALADLEEERVLELVRQRVDAGDDPSAILEECRAGTIREEPIVSQRSDNVGRDLQERTGRAGAQAVSC